MSTKSKAQGELLAKTLNQLFEKPPKAKKKITTDEELPVSRHDLALALTVILVDLASCDQTFEQSEYNIIARGLHQIFGANPREAQKLVNQATIALGNLRGTGHYVSLLALHLSASEKKAVEELIQELIMADGVEDPFETYHHTRLKDLLNL